MASILTNDCGDFDADEMFRTYLHDYLIKRGLLNTAEIFKIEAQVSTDSSVADSPTGLLQEWWSIFYDKFISSQWGNPEAKPAASSSNVPNMTDIPRNDATLKISQMLINEHVSLPQSQAISSFSNIMMGQSDACSRSSSLYNIENLDIIEATNPNFLPGTMMPLDGPHQTKNNEAPNLVQLNGMPSNVGDVNQVFIPSYLQHCEVLKAKNQEAVLSQALRCTSKKQIVTSPRSSTKYRKKNRKIPETESSNRDTKINRSNRK